MGVRNLSNPDTYLLTSESVSDGHPDKICDQVSDAVVDAALRDDPASRVACETSCTSNRMWLFGEVTTASNIDYEDLARSVIRDIGYTDPSFNFDHDSADVSIFIHEQSADINAAVGTPDLNQGAGDQGLMIGYAVDETEELMPLPIAMAHRLTRAVSESRRNGDIPFLRPDAKSQVTVEYSQDHKPLRIDTIVISSWHDPDVDQETIATEVKAKVIEQVVPENLRDSNTKLEINPSGKFAIGGPHGDAGLTGRKIIVDSYGGSARHGGGAFSGKDPSKVDRSGAYAARYVAKNIVAAGLASRAEVQLAYAIGVADPVSIMVDTHETGRIPDTHIARIVQQHFDLRPRAVISGLDLLRPIYRDVAAFGHFGRSDLDLPWERTDKAASLASAA